MWFFTDGGSKDDYPPHGGIEGVGLCGVFWLLEEKILHKGRSGVNRGDRKIFGGKRRKSPDRFIYPLRVRGCCTDGRNQRE